MTSFLTILFISIFCFGLACVCFKLIQKFRVFLKARKVIKNSLNERK